MAFLKEMFFGVSILRIDDTGFGKKERFSEGSASVIDRLHWASTSGTELQPARLLLMITSVFGLTMASQIGAMEQNDRSGLSSTITPIIAEESKFTKEETEEREAFPVIEI